MQTFKILEQLQNNLEIWKTFAYPQKLKNIFLRLSKNFSNFEVILQLLQNFENLQVLKKAKGLFFLVYVAYFPIFEVNIQMIKF